MNVHNSEHWKTCPSCGKRLYLTRAGAKEAAKKIKANTIPSLRRGIRPYLCPQGEDGWHIGHLPQATIHGLATADEVYGRADR